MYIPSVDISRFTDGTDEVSRQVGQAVNKACKEIGFIVITGHGFPPELLNDMDAKLKAFFDLPREIKDQYNFKEGTEEQGFFGYQGFGTSNLAFSLDNAEAKPDLREAFAVCKPDRDEDPDYFSQEGLKPFCTTIVWPDEHVPGFSTTWTAYYKKMVELGARIMSIFAVALDLPPDYFEPLLDHQVSNLGAFNYPELRDVKVEEGQIRGGAHTDFGNLTILHADFSIPGGIQVLTCDGTWFDVPGMPGSFVINIGDLMQRWANDKWVSTLHRVTNPPAVDGVQARRQSIAFFHHINYDAVVECIPTCLEPGAKAKYPPITAGNHTLMKLGKMYEESLDT